MQAINGALKVTLYKAGILSDLLPITDCIRERDITTNKIHYSLPVRASKVML